MYNSVVQQIAHHVERQDTSARVHLSDVSGQSGSTARTHAQQDVSPTSLRMKMELAEGDDEHLMGTENSQLEQAPSSPSLEDHAF